MILIHPSLQIFFAVSKGGTGTIMILGLTELMGLYAVSSIVLIRKQLPQKYRSGLCQVLRDFPVPRSNTPKKVHPSAVLSGIGLQD